MNPLGLPHRAPFCAAPDVPVHSASVHRSPAPRLRGPCGGDAVPSGCGAPRKPGEGAETLPRGVVPAEGGRLGRPGRVRCFMGGGSASGGGQGLNQGRGGVGRLHAEACAPTPATVVQGPCRDPRRLRVPPRALGPSFFWVPRAASRRQHRACSARDQNPPFPSPAPSLVFLSPVYSPLHSALPALSPSFFRGWRDEALEWMPSWRPRGMGRAQSLGGSTLRVQ